MGKEGQPVSWGTMAHDHDMYMMLVELACEIEDRSTLEKYIPLLEELAERDGHQLQPGRPENVPGVRCIDCGGILKLLRTAFRRQ